MDSVLQVNKAYEWVRFHNFDARHVICAFRIPGPMSPSLQDYEDNDEHNAGKALLDYMIEAGIENRAIFVTRHYEGVHIGIKRFECIIDAAKWAINCKPFNRVSQTFQFSWPQHKARGGRTVTGQPLKHINDTTQSDWEGSDAEIEFNVNHNDWSTSLLPMEKWSDASKMPAGATCDQTGSVSSHNNAAMCTTAASCPGTSEADPIPFTNKPPSTVPQCS